MHATRAGQKAIVSSGYLRRYASQPSTSLIQSEKSRTQQCQMQEEGYGLLPSLLNGPEMRGANSSSPTITIRCPCPWPSSQILVPASCVCKQTGGGGIRSPGSEMPARIAGRENAGTTAWMKSRRTRHLSTPWPPLPVLKQGLKASSPADSHPWRGRASPPPPFIPASYPRWVLYFEPLVAGVDVDGMGMSLCIAGPEAFACRQTAGRHYQWWQWHSGVQ